MEKKGIMCLLIVSLLFVSCASTRRTDSAILEYQRKIDILEARVKLYENTIGSTIEELGAIRERAENTDGTIDELICLFDDYQRAVERLLEHYRTTEAEDKDEK